MKRLAFVSAFAIVAAMAVGSSTAHAQSDHLKCFKAKDSAKFDATATLSALQTQFGLDESCQIKGKGKLFCVPVTKQVTAFEDNSKDGIPQVPVTGQVLEDDRVCYKVKCPKTEIAPEVVTDQFGTRTMEKFKADLLCTPAIKGEPPTTTTTTLPPPICCDLSPQGATLCVQAPATAQECQAAPGLPGNAGDICDAATGTCLPATSAGPCCDLGGFCFAGPDVSQEGCDFSEPPGTFFPNAECSADGACVEGTTPTTTTTLPVSHDQCQAVVTPGCPGCACEDAVCTVDPFCCNVSWDDFCVQECEAAGVTCPPRSPYCGETSAPTCGGDCSWSPGTTCLPLISGNCLPSGTSCTENVDCVGEPLVQECITCACVF